MSKFRKRPVVIWAEQLLPGEMSIPSGVMAETPAREVEHGIEHTGKTRYYLGTGDPATRVEIIPGDWVITDAEGKQSMCPESEFNSIYEEVRPEEVTPLIPGHCQGEIVGAFVASLFHVRETARALETCEVCMGMTAPLSDAIEASDTIQRKLKEIL